MEGRRSDGGATNEVTSAQRRRGPPVTQRPSVVVRLAGAALVVIGSFGLLGTPMVLMFSEGIPDSWANIQGAYLGLWAAASLACIVIGNGIFQGREWARFLAIGFCAVLWLSTALAPPFLLIDLALAAVLVFGRRPVSGGR